jgi:hypothetical protein
MRQSWATLRAAEMSAKQAAMLAFTILVSLPASAQDARFDPSQEARLSQSQQARFDLSQQVSAPTRIQRNSAGKQPYSLGARKTHIITEQDQRIEPPAADSALARQNPRADNTLNANVSANAIPLYADKSALGAFQQPSDFLRGKTKTNVRLLSEYDVELIVDSSQSMRKLDCPGGLSRWNWCGIQAKDLGRQLVPYVPRGLTITAFARDYDVYRNATTSNIAELFDYPNFRGGTRLSKPLYDRLNEFFARRQPGSKPLLIAVITDGVPHPFEEPELVAQTLVNATMRMKDPREVTVVFFQIGSRDRFGRAFLNYLDNGLVENGARYDFVKAVPFEHLVQVGLSQALVESIQQFAARSGKLPIR